MSELRSCGVLIYRGSPISEFLLMKHSRRWDLPKGHVDPGETEMQCALRELEEETGLQDDVIEVDPNFRFETRYLVSGARTGGEQWPKTLVVFLGRLTVDQPIVTTEHESYAWFHWDPPHHIQQQTIDPLLKAVEMHVQAANDDR